MPCSFLRCIPICFWEAIVLTDVVGAVRTAVVNCTPGVRVDDMSSSSVNSSALRDILIAPER